MNIKFAAVTRKGKEINSVVTTVNALEEHKILTADYGSKFALQSFEIFEKNTVDEYLERGWSVELVAAIDFTASNGDPQSLTSNHSILKEMNDYEKVLSDMGQQIEIEKEGNPIGEEIDFSSSFQVFGFGGIPRYMDIHSVNDCFALNGDPLNPEIQGIENVL